MLERATRRRRLLALSAAVLLLPSIVPAGVAGSTLAASGPASAHPSSDPVGPGVEHLPDFPAGADHGTHADGISGDGGETPSTDPDRTAPGDGTASAVPAANETLQVHLEYDLTQSRPGSVRVTIEYTVPGGRETIRELVDYDAVLSNRGFVREGNDSLRWDGETRNPRLVIQMQVNRSDGGYYEAVDTGDWAFFGLRHHYPNASVTRTAVGGGTFGDDWAVLGDHTVYRREGARHDFELVVAGSEAPAVPPERTLRELDRASQLLEVGEKGVDRNLTVWVLPPPIRPGGAAVPEAFWASSDSNFRYASTFIHEYVHTRQDELYVVYDTEEATAWLREGTASMYGTLTNWRLDNDVSFRNLRGQATVDASTVLANTSTYGGDRPGYGQGEGVLIALDYRIRVATDGERSFQDVFRRLNAREVAVDAAELQRISEDVAGRDFDAFFDRYVYEQNDPPAPPHPGPYDFVETASVTASVEADAPVTDGRIVVVSSRHYSVYNGSPRLPDADEMLNEHFYTYTVVDPGPDGAASVPVERITATPFDRYGLVYVQAHPGGRRFPADGVADLAVVGVAESVPYEAGTTELDGADRTTVTVVDGNGDPVEGAKVRLGRVRNGQVARISLETDANGRILARNGTSGLELLGYPTVDLQSVPDGYPLQSFEGTIPEDGPLDVRFVAREAVDPVYVQGTAVPGNLSTGTSTMYLLVGSSALDPRRGIQPPVYVDGELVTDVDVPARDDIYGWIVPFEVTFEDPGTHTLRVGDLPPRTVTVTDASPADRPDPDGDGTPSADVDDDGHFEDVDGDGGADVVDVQLLFVTVNEDDVRPGYDEYFDFDGDGDVDIVDVQTLFVETNGD